MIPGLGKQRILIGSAPHCDIRLTAPGVMPEHAAIVLQNGGKIPGLDKVVPRADVEAPAASAGSTPVSTIPVRRSGETIRIATFNIQVFGETKAQNVQVMDVLARVIRNFDVVAVQEVRARSQDVVPYLVEQVNATGRRYDYVIGERLGRIEEAALAGRQPAEATGREPAA